MKMTNKSLDIILLGATGFTGKCVAKYLTTLTKEKSWHVTWGISGRSQEKISNLLTELNEPGLGLNNIPILKVDIMEKESLQNVVQAAKIVINCTGPHFKLSPLIVQACIKAGTHYVDISAEMYHILNLYRTYHKASEDANVLVVPACGYAVIPAESALLYLERQFKGTLHTVECHSTIYLPKRSWIPGQTLLHNGTWTSLVHVMRTYKEHLALWHELKPKPVEPEPEEIKQSFFHRYNGRFWFPYPGPEDCVVAMSQRYLHEKTGKKPVHFKCSTAWWRILNIFIPILFLYYYLTYFKCFVTLLIKFPRLFTFGFVSEKGPSERMRKNMKYDFVLDGKGWELNAALNSKPTKTLSVKVSGCDPGYNTTAVAIVMCAITILKESSNMPKGGVLTPGAAFYKTDIIDRLMHNCLTFEVVQK